MVYSIVVIMDQPNINPNDTRKPEQSEIPASQPASQPPSQPVSTTQVKEKSWKNLWGILGGKKQKSKSRSRPRTKKNKTKKNKTTAKK